MTLPSPPVTASPELLPEPPRRRPVLDLLVRVAGGVVAVVAAVVTGVVELLCSTLRIGGVPTGVAVLLVVLGNAALSWFAYRAVGRRWAVLLPALPWFALMLVAAGRTSEGDVLLAGDNWVGVAMIAVGSLTFAVAGYRLILAPRPGQPPVPGR
ncbi:hypothetical protein AB0J86_21715 [Micromonospora sp. NPDC049559]|uniref:hypothetical protein n=1 Tax=Micromonospora sp. NPDC049559 TaxID=3155923 RepID=UPI00343F2753